MITPEKIETEFRKVQDHICTFLLQETGDTYREDQWEYTSGNGGGITRIISGDVIEKGGVNFSALSGELSEKIATQLKAGSDRKFYATGVSLVIHPVNPFIPTIHMNIRYLERGGKKWFGGGIDLTPYYPEKKDIITFHRMLKNICDAHNPQYYPIYKKQCDDYFFIKHRGEARGVGGIFFDYLNTELDKNCAFTLDVGMGFNQLYTPFLKKYIHHKYSSQHKKFQEIRRGRYVEFNLVYDRGTLFGLETKGRIESILMSLPLKAQWHYDFSPEAGTKEAELTQYLVPQDWASME